LERTKVDQILRQGKRAIGVKVTILHSDGRKITKNIMAKHCVICCAGALHSPCLLLRSKFKNHHIGRHLFMHPSCGASASFSPSPPQQQTTSDNNKNNKNNKFVKGRNVWEDYVETNKLALDKNNNDKSNNTSSPPQMQSTFGAPMTVICNEFAKGPNDDGYGAKLEVPCLHTSLLGGLIPWMDPYMYKHFAQNAVNSLGLIVLQRDSGDGGRVKDDNGFAHVDYSLNDADEASMVWALTKSIEMCVKNGASRISLFGNVLPLELGNHNNNSVDSPLVQDYLKKVKDMKLKNFAATLGNAHQMGTCRMGTSPETSVVNEDGKLWECENVFVMDTSLFPTSLGVNPMLTVLTISHMLSTRLAKSLQEDLQPTQKK